MTNPIHDNIDLVALADTTWRVCDTRFGRGDPRWIVGYLRQENGAFELMWMRPRPGISRWFPTIDHAVRAAELSLN